MNTLTTRRYKLQQAEAALYCTPLSPAPCSIANSRPARTALPSGTETTVTILLAVLLILWVLGLATANTMGGLIHLLLVVAVVVVVFRIMHGQNPLRG